MWIDQPPPSLLVATGCRGAGRPCFRFWPRHSHCHLGHLSCTSCRKPSVPAHSTPICALCLGWGGEKASLHRLSGPLSYGGGASPAHSSLVIFCKQAVAHRERATLPRPSHACVLRFLGEWALSVRSRITCNGSILFPNEAPVTAHVT